MQELSPKDEAKKEGLMALIKKMYEMMDASEAKKMEEGQDGEEMAEEGSEEAPSMEDKGPGLMAKAMEKAGAPSEEDGDLDMGEIQDFLTKKRKSPVGKSINFMAVTKVEPKKMDAPKKKYG